MRRIALIPTLLALLLVASCGKEIGRIPFTGEGEGETTVTLQAKKVALWADLDLAYVGDASLTYQVELLEAGTVKASTTCDPLGFMSVKVGWVETDIGPRHSRSGQGRMGCGFSAPAAGTYVVRAKLAFGQRPAGLTLTQADLVIKQ